MNRIDRIAAILIQLQSKRIVKAQDIAERFSISLRTVYRDIRTLEEAGVPILGEAGVGYSIMEGYRLPPVMFTKEEATAFITAEKLVEKFTDHALESNYKSAMMKIRAVLRSAEKDLLETIDESIEVHRAQPVNAVSEDKLKRLPIILEHIASKKRLRIEYMGYGKTDKSIRTIEPMGVFFSSGYWHCIAWCNLRHDYRDFRTDRMHQLTGLDEPFERNHPSLRDYLTEIREKEKLTQVQVKIDNRVIPFLAVQKYYFGFVAETVQGDHTVMEFLTQGEEYFLRWLISFADAATVIYPSSLKDKLAKLIQNIKNRQERPDRYPTVRDE